MGPIPCLGAEWSVPWSVTGSVMARIKILYYNWVDFEDPLQRGGGVSIYQRNLVDAARHRGDEVWFFSSGASYSPFSRRPFLREAKSRIAGVRKFELVNSEIFSPGHAAFGKDVLSSPPMEAVFTEFLREHGPFDVVHFNNLEGVPASFLRLAREHAPGTRVVYSLHNYYPFCPQVNLWFQEKAACRDFREGKKCVNCLVTPPGPRATKRFYQVEYCMRLLGVPPHSGLFRLASWFIHGPLRRSYRWAKNLLRLAAGRGRRNPESAKPAVILDAAAAARFAQRRQAMVEALNTYADHVLAVSRRVAELAVGFGIDPARVRTMYIGTRFAEQAALGEHSLRECGSDSRSESATLPGGVLRMAYLGYMRRDKGFYFFLSALEKMPAGLTRRLGLVFAARIWDRHAYDRIKRIAHRFAAVTFYDGYTHARLPRILAGVDLGIVPVLWEDNLPQVAIECVASGVPVLTSDRGGARELLDCPSLVFKAGSAKDLYARLRAILDDPELLRAAQAGRARLYTPAEHYDLLRAECYQTAAAVEAEAQSSRGPALEPGLCPSTP